MAKASDAPPSNRHESRETWLRSATNELRPYFESQGYPLPEFIRFAIAFPSTGRKGRRVGECWHPEASADQHFEIILRADIADPVEVLCKLVHELVHAALPADAGHGKLFKKAALKLGLTDGPMRYVMPGKLLVPKLEELAAALGPLPHAKLDIERTPDGKRPADRPKKQRARLLKAECTDPECEYTVRITSKWVKDLGPPGCPKHGPMTVDLPDSDAETDEETGSETGSHAPTEGQPVASSFSTPST